MLTIARLTCHEMLKRRVFHLAVILTVIYLALYGIALHFAYREPIRDVLVQNIVATQLSSVGLYFSSFIIAFLTVLGSVGAISTEIENGVLQTILVKPLERREVVLGKYLGMAVIMLAYAAFFYLAIIGLNIGLSQGRVHFYWLNAVRALGFYASLPLVILAPALWGSAFLGTLNNGIMMVMLYSFATIGGILEQVGYVAPNAALVNIGIVSSLFLPTDALYHKVTNTLFAENPNSMPVFIDSFFNGSFEPSLWMVFYTLVYTLFFVWWAARIFSKRDI